MPFGRVGRFVAPYVLLGAVLLAGNPPATGGAPSQGASESQKLLTLHQAGAGTSKPGRSRGARPSEDILQAAARAQRSLVGSGVEVVRLRPDRVPGGGELRVADPPRASRGADGAGVRIFRENVGRVVLVMTPHGLGSGVIVRDGEQILTNNHVIAGESRVVVYFYPGDSQDLQRSDGRVAAVVGADPTTDLALLRLQNQEADRPRAALGKLVSVPVGSQVYAIGHPNELPWSFTEGVVSQIRRNHTWMAEDGVHRATVIQTQTPINPGNSGGPLFNSDGEIVGINSFKDPEAENLNFAISSEDIESFLADPPKPGGIGAGGGERIGPPRPEGGVDLDEDGLIDAYEFDRDGNGRADLWVYDLDRDGTADAFGLDLDGDGTPDTVAFDKNGDGRLDVFHHDANGDGVPESFAIDYDGDGIIDRTGLL